MMKKVAVLVAFMLLGICAAVVVQAETVRGEGRYITHTLTHLGPFHAIDVRGDAQVDIWQQDTLGVSLSGKSNLVALADIRVENQTLLIDFKRPVHIKGAHALHVTVAIPQLESIVAHERARVRVRGAFETPKISIIAAENAYVTADSVKSDWLRLQATNKAEIDLERIQIEQLEAGLFDKAEIELSGFAQKAQLVNNGSGDIEADSLRVTDAHAQVNATGKIELFATQFLHAQANGKGKIIYHGQPVLSKEGHLNKIQPAFD